MAVRTILMRVLFLLLIGFVGLKPAQAADHREAPFVDEHPAGDLTDVYAFVDPNDASRLVLAMGVNPFSVPSAMPSYDFSPDYLYQFKIDTNGDAVEDFVLQVKFAGRFATQTVQVFGPSHPAHTGARNQILGDGPAVRGVAGAVIGDPDGLLVFTGPRDDPFVFDNSQLSRILSGAQDLFRAATLPIFGALRGRPVRADGTSGVDGFGGFNASYIVVSFPKLWVRGRSSRVNVWGTVSQPLVSSPGRGPSHHSRTFVQFEREGQPAFSTVFVPKDLKDQFNNDVPANDVARYSQLVPDALTTTDNDGTGNTIAGRAAVLNALGLDALPTGVPLLLPANFGNTNRNLLRGALLPDVMRLDLDAASGDLGIGQFGLTNGRRPGDDSIDIALRLLRQLADVNFSGVPAGTPGSGPARPGALNFPADRRVLAVLQGTDFMRPDATLSDLSTSGNDKALPSAFPFVAAPHPLPGSADTIGFPPQE